MCQARMEGQKTIIFFYATIPIMHYKPLIIFTPMFILDIRVTDRMNIHIPARDQPLLVEKPGRWNPFSWL